VNGHWPSSQVFVLPTMTAPAARSLRTTSASTAAGAPARRAEHRRHTRDVDVVLDRDRNSSSGACSPAARLRSALAASASACFLNTTRNALRVGWLASISRSDFRTSSSEVTVPLASRYSRLVRVGMGDWMRRIGRHGRRSHQCREYPALPTALVGTRWETGRMRLYRDRAVVLRQHSSARPTGS
jgi:hypothetical protein